MAEILDGNVLARQLNDELRSDLSSWVEQGHRRPKLACVLVGEDYASTVYVRKKIQAAESVGIDAELVKMADSITEGQLLDKITSMNEDEGIDGLLVQLPVPNHISERTICNAVAAEKDVDGFNVLNVGRLCVDMHSLVPATPLGVREMIVRNGIETKGKNVVVVGRSKNVGLPIAMLLHSDGKHESGLGMDATVTVCHRNTPREQLRMHCLNADIIITATGVPGLITADMVKPGATVIDVGITRVVGEDEKARLRGDVDYQEVVKIAGAVTPVPGGVGPVTVAMLLRNTLQAAKGRVQKDK